VTDHETVLRDLLLELGVEGVTLWHIRCLAAYLRGRYILRADSRWLSDLRGEEAVWCEAWDINAVPFSQPALQHRERECITCGYSPCLCDQQ
jgi:hypothetical protein